MKVIATTPFRYKGKRVEEGAEVDVTEKFLKENGHVCASPISLKEAAAKAEAERLKTEEEAKRKEAEAKAKAEEEAKKGGS